MDPDHFTLDTQATIRNASLIRQNNSLAYWYEAAFKIIFHLLNPRKSSLILEIGSGGSPLKRFFPGLITSDILPLPHVDLVLDCQQINSCVVIDDHSLDAIIGFNTLHHISNPLLFLNHASVKLKSQAKVYLLEPFFSTLSTPIYQYLHPESANMSLEEPYIHIRTGPLSSSEQCLPYLLFFKQKTWLESLRSSYDINSLRLIPYSSLSYFVTGGVTLNSHLPLFLYRPFHRIDQLLASNLPNCFASFFIVELRTL